MASATIVPVGLTAYGWLSLPIQTAAMRCGSMPARASALRAASTLMVAVSSSRPGTDFSRTGLRLLPLVHTRLISLPGSRNRGTYAPYPTMPTGRIGWLSIISCPDFEFLTDERVRG
jgi:hypothetical protein